MTRIPFKNIIRVCAIALFCFSTNQVLAENFNLPAFGDALLGDIQYVPLESGGITPTTLAQRFNLGLNAIVAANPGSTETAVVADSGYVKIPTEFLLPPLPRKGIVINLPEMRLYFYPEGSDTVMTFPIGIGKIGETVPIRNTTIVRKTVNPVWIPGPHIRKFNEEQGIDLPRVMPPGPDNPLGPYALYLGIPSFLIHSTIFPESIGRRASFGCLRMNEGDIKEFYPLVQTGTSVLIVNIPDKVGWEGDKLYLEAHPPMEEHNSESEATVDGVISAVQQALPKGAATVVNWQLVSYLAKQPDGVPHEIGMRLH
jgi:L,D-transpeptidase ErfK/SrfK